MAETNKQYNIIFMGTPDFSVPSLRALANDRQFNILFAVTQPDKKTGRKQILTPPAVKIESEKNHLRVLQPEKLSQIIPEIRSANPDLIIVIAYAKKISKEILLIPKHGVINVHGSLLPKYRGASCVQSAILAGDKTTGVTIMKMDENIDTGPVLAQKEISIDSNETYKTLYDKLSVLGAELLIPTLKKYLNNEISPKKQDDINSSYSPVLTKEAGIINWLDAAEHIERFVRAMDPWPSAWTKLNGKTVKILSVQRAIIDINDYKPGELFLYDDELAVQCGRGSLIIEKLLVEGKKPMDAKTFLHGCGDSIGSILG